ncbi:hypothetical protein DOTSEDRAFT_30345 [Dothistroma septosporum NZE10]|uniref:Uncharacterized protein n=1 Tax=Dothistroma septosporum (strain NZE10 / CBS 128990) TaxID=675120 RepID=N1PZR9_DOTSN|nr:hypothetical protein DOTSEDRAFT_30345 [Dothistroma septosporum NZE10]
MVEAQTTCMHARRDEVVAAGSRSSETGQQQANSSSSACRATAHSNDETTRTASSPLSSCCTARLWAPPPCRPGGTEERVQPHVSVRRSFDLEATSTWHMHATTTLTPFQEVLCATEQAQPRHGRNGPAGKRWATPHSYLSGAPKREHLITSHQASTDALRRPCLVVRPRSINLSAPPFGWLPTIASAARLQNTEGPCPAASSCA